jgi:hypothetical protein
MNQSDSSIAVLLHSILQYSSKIRGICVRSERESVSLKSGVGSLIKRKQSQKTRSSLLRFSVTSAGKNFSCDRPLARRYGFWGLWLSGGPLSGRERAFRLRSPNYPYLPCISCLVFCQFASPRFVTWWPKWPEPAEDTSGASGCGGRSRELASRPLPLDTCFDEASVSTS